MDWEICDESGPVVDLLEPPHSPPTHRIANFVAPTDAAVILGSTQSAEEINQEACDAQGLGVHRRASGGGAVVVSPGAQIWLEVFVPVGDALFERDVTRASWWLGDLWQAAISTAIGSSEPLRVHHGSLVQSPVSRSLCFLGAGPGEVFSGDRKIVGLAQRRNRFGAWLFTMAHVRFDPVSIAALVKPSRPSSITTDELSEELGRRVEVLDERGQVVESELRRRLRNGF